jgi:hypothetical protein
LLLAEPLAPLDQALKVGLNRREIEVLGITSRHGKVKIVWHVGSRRVAATEFLRREWRSICQMMVDEQLTIRLDP